MTIKGCVIKLSAFLLGVIRLRTGVSLPVVVLRESPHERSPRKAKPLDPLLWLISVGLFTLTACGGSSGNSSSTPGSAVDTITMTFTVCIDGRDELIIQGTTLQWQYLDFEPVGASSNCPDNTTIISTTLNGNPVMNAVTWQPMYPPGSISSGEVTLPFTSLSPTLPNNPTTATLTVIQARDSLAMTQFPSNANGGTMILDFNDDPSPGAAIYSAEVTITVPHSP